MIIEWPTSILPPVEIGVDLVYASRSPGDPWAGHRQIIAPLVSEWRLPVTFSLHNEDSNRVFRAIKAALKGRYAELLFPICDPWRVKRSAAHWLPAPVRPTTLHSDDTMFSDDVGYAEADIATTVSIAASEGDEDIWLNVAGINDALGIGHFFSIDDYLYVVRFDGYGERVSDRRQFGIAPELRADVAAGARVEIGRPRIRCRLAEDGMGGGPLNLGKFGAPTLEFVECAVRLET